jgi:hypothetical protein
LTIAATSVSKTYGATYTPNTTTPPTDFTVSGLLFSDSVTSITLMSAGYPAAALPTPSGYTITPSAAVGTGLGNYTITYTPGTLTITYGTCSGSTPSGVILQPINSDGTSVYPRKGGSTIPVKFTVCDASGNPISNPAAVFAGTGGSITLLSAVRGTIDGVNEMGDTIDVPDVGFRYSSGIWIFNMATSNLTSGMTYTYRINLAYGSITFKIGIK